MSTQPSYLKDLKRFSRDQNPPPVDALATIKQVMQESDRGSVILTSAKVEDALEFAITAVMAGIRVDPRLRDSVFGSSGVAPSFSAKNDLARALGLIDYQTWKYINLIREMRNACAHARQFISFETPELRAISDVLFGDAMSFFVAPSHHLSYRAAFLLKCVELQERIAKGEKARTLSEIFRSIEPNAALKPFD